MDWRRARESLKDWFSAMGRVSAQWADEPQVLQPSTHALLRIGSITRDGHGWKELEERPDGSLDEVRYQEKRANLSVIMRGYDQTRGLDTASALDEALALLLTSEARAELLLCGFSQYGTGPAIDSPGYELDGRFFPQANATLVLGFIDQESRTQVQVIDSVSGTLNPKPGAATFPFEVDL